MQVTCCHCHGQVVVRDKDVGRPVGCPHCRKGIVPKRDPEDEPPELLPWEPIEAEIDESRRQPEPTGYMVRCYDCGSVIDAADAVRRTVATASSSGGATSFGRGTPVFYSSTVREKVDLCQRCNGRRDAAAEEIGKVIFIVLLIFLTGALFLVGAIGLSMLWSRFS